jgi:hypothetical protein
MNLAIYIANYAKGIYEDFEHRVPLQALGLVDRGQVDPSTSTPGSPSKSS